MKQPHGLSALKTLLQTYVPPFVVDFSPSLPIYLVLDQVSHAQIAEYDVLIEQLRTSTRRNVWGVLQLESTDTAPSYIQLHSEYLQIHNQPLALVLSELIALAGSSGVLVVNRATQLSIVGALGELARRLGRTEILVLYDYQVTEELLSHALEGVLPHRTILELDQLYGSRHWREVLNSFDDPQLQQRALSDIWTQALISIGGSRFRWSAAMPRLNSWGELAYQWVFASSERSAGPLMSEALYTAYGSYHDTPEAFLNRETGGTPKQVSLFDEAPPHATKLLAEKISQIIVTIENLCDTQPRLWSYGDLRDHVLRTGWFGRCSEAQIHVACEALERAGRIERRNPAAEWQAGTLVRLR